MLSISGKYEVNFSIEAIDLRIGPELRRTLTPTKAFINLTSSRHCNFRAAASDTKIRTQASSAFSTAARVGRS